MKVAIVGAEESKWTEEQKQKAKESIARIFVNCVVFATGLMDQRFIGKGDYKYITLVSGHCHRGGVDIWAEHLADELGIPKEIYPAEVHQWNDLRPYGELSDEMGRDDPARTLKGYRSRNIQIAEACDVL